MAVFNLCYFPNRLKSPVQSSDQLAKVGPEVLVHQAGLLNYFVYSTEETGTRTEEG